MAGLTSEEYFSMDGTLIGASLRSSRRKDETPSTTWSHDRPGRRPWQAAPSRTCTARHEGERRELAASRRPVEPQELHGVELAGRAAECSRRRCAARRPEEKQGRVVTGSAEEHRSEQEELRTGHVRMCTSRVPGGLGGQVDAHRSPLDLSRSSWGQPGGSVTAPRTNAGWREVGRELSVPGVRGGSARSAFFPPVAVHVETCQSIRALLDR